MKSLDRNLVQSAGMESLCYKTLLFNQWYEDRRLEAREEIFAIIKI
jgi:hypothetical protein